MDSEGAERRAEFAGLRPAAGRDHATWVVSALTGRTGVDLVVPAGYEAYARVHHPLRSGTRWADVAPQYLVRGTEPYEYPGPRPGLLDGDGRLDRASADELISLLASATTTPDDCHYALWSGWGWVSGSIFVWSSDEETGAAMRAEADEATARVRSFAAACPVQPWWGGRDMILLDGPIAAVNGIGWPDPVASNRTQYWPQWWWPEDRAWFVGTEIDHAWTYVAGVRRVVQSVLGSSRWEAVSVDATDRW